MTNELLVLTALVDAKRFIKFSRRKLGREPINLSATRERCPRVLLSVDVRFAPKATQFRVTAK
jgi:hypothetical protein